MPNALYPEPLMAVKGLERFVTGWAWAIELK